jgi:hypothetical protein
MHPEYKYQIFADDKIPHQPPQLSKEQWRTLGHSGSFNFWVGLSVYVLFVIILNSTDSLLGIEIRKPYSSALLGILVFYVLVVPLIPAILVVSQFNKLRRRKQWSKLDLEQTERESQEAQDRRKQSDALSQKLNTLLISSEDLVPKLSEYLKSASGWLDIARREHTENAYDPFWTAIENAAKNIGAFNDGVSTLSSNTRNYYTSLKATKHSFPVFPTRLDKLPDSKPVMEEFRRVVRLGQTNFQFANIWEHRKTRDVLIAGFRTLGEAVNNLTSVVEREISTLSDTLHSDLAQVVEEQIRSREAIEKSLEEQAKIREAIDKSKH